MSGLSGGGGATLTEAAGVGPAWSAPDRCERVVVAVATTTGAVGDALAIDVAAVDVVALGVVGPCASSGTDDSGAFGFWSAELSIADGVGFVRTKCQPTKMKTGAAHNNEM
ncbi:MAG: hypothetical protein ABI183_07430, partial [Polyangiaceae bacterium]